MAARVSQAGALAVTVGTPGDRVSQAGALAVTTGTPKARTSQTGVLVVTSLETLAPARVSQAGLLVVYATPGATSAPAGRLTLLGVG